MLPRQAGSGLDLDQLDVTGPLVPELARAINPGMARQAPQVTLVLMKHSCRGVRVYEQINALPPAGIGKKSAMAGSAGCPPLRSWSTTHAGSAPIGALRRFCIE